MDLRHLQAFCAVAREMHVTRAAKRLCMAQPALTQQIRLLERELGVVLLQRNGRGIELTEAGTFFYKEAEGILDSWVNASMKVREIARGEAGHLRIGVTEAAAFNPKVAAMFNAFRRQWPGVNLLFSQKQTLELANDLRTGLIDIAFMCPLPVPEGIETVRLYREPMLLAVPRAHRLARENEISIESTKDELFILVSHGSTHESLEMSLKVACARRNFVPRILQTTPEFMLALNLVASGIALTFVPPYMASIHPDTIKFCGVEPSAAITIEIVLARREGDASAAAQNLHEAALSTFGRGSSPGKRGSGRKDRRPAP